MQPFNCVDMLKWIFDNFLDPSQVV